MVLVCDESRKAGQKFLVCCGTDGFKSNADTITAGLQGGVELLMWIKRSTILDKQNTAKVRRSDNCRPPLLYRN